MRLLSFELAGRAAVGAMVSDTDLIDLASAYRRQQGRDNPQFTDMLSLIRAGDEALDAARQTIEGHSPEDLISVNEIRFLPPLPLPEQVRDFANYELHCLQALESSMRMRASKTADPEQTYREFVESGAYVIPPIWYEQPLYFKCNRFSTLGHDNDLHWPTYSNVMDYELELACVIGKGGKDISRENAREHIFGYTIYNDFSARDAQSQEMAFRMGPAKGKDFDGGHVFGPWIVTRDELPDPYHLQMAVRVNGEERGRGNSGDCQHNFERCIEHVSMGETIHPGEILALGTIGNGSGFEINRYLESGDVVELEVEGIGVLRNRVLKD